MRAKVSERFASANEFYKYQSAKDWKSWLQEGVNCGAGGARQAAVGRGRWLLGALALRADTSA